MQHSTFTKLSPYTAHIPLRGYINERIPSLFIVRTPLTVGSKDNVLIPCQDMPRTINQLPSEALDTPMRVWPDLTHSLIGRLGLGSCSCSIVLVNKIPNV